MKKLLFTFLSVTLLGACSSSPVVVESSFDIIFSYGYGVQDNKLDSIQNTFTKDMILADPITVELTLSDDELKEIEDKITELNLFESDEDEAPIQVSPCEHYSITAEYNTKRDNGGRNKKTKSMMWNCSQDTGPNAEFVDFMKDLIESQEEYQALPEVEGAYM